MSELSSPWRIERACLAAWPALEETQAGGWTARFSRGFTRRANSANPLGSIISEIDSGVAAVEAFYRARGAPAIFRVPTLLDPAVDRRLESLGYAVDGAFSTLYGPLADLARAGDAGVALSSRPSGEWLAAQGLFQGHGAEEKASYAGIVGLLRIPCAFAALRREGALVALAYGALAEGLFIVESVVTKREARGQGHARRLLSALFAEGARAGASAVALQVEAKNEPALRLYASLGLKSELYRYHYRRRPRP